MKKFVKITGKLFIVILLTILTQIGGLLYLGIEIFFRKNKNQKFIKPITFFILYGVSTFLIVPLIAPIFGRVKIKDSEQLAAHTFITKVCNRNYVNPELHTAIHKISAKIQKTHPGIQVFYLDANFPFFDGFPLPPHLSHDDGEKIDLSFIYADYDKKITNNKPGYLGYGYFVDPQKNEYNQINVCKNKGYWQYDMAKYLTLGISNNSLIFSEKATKDLLLAILEQAEIQKIFIEPHLKKRLGLSHSKIRFHGCQALRHDDHIHIQL